MKPEFNSRRLFGITRAKGKMYELGLPEKQHIAIPPKDEPEELFCITVGTLGDVAAELSNAEKFLETNTAEDAVRDLDFAASFFDAFLASRFSEKISQDVSLLAAAAYYLARRPGSSLVLASKLNGLSNESAVDRLLRWVLQARWNTYPNGTDALFGNKLTDIARLLAFHFHNGSNKDELKILLREVRRIAYDTASARELLYLDIISAVIFTRLEASAWTTLPIYTDISIDQWAPIIQRQAFPKELWPSQLLLGKAGIFSGLSGIIQMPTSAGKTRSIEIILRSGFLSGRTKVAVVIAPFRALCHEIGTTLRQSFSQDDVKVDELSDALQLDFLEQMAELFGSEIPNLKYVLVLTPEKLLYILRQAPNLAKTIGIVVYDEGHQFDSGSRGITYELLLTEIKALLTHDAQTILVSAVIQNAKEVGQWLIGDAARIVSGTGLLPTARSVAFASWLESVGQLMFFESDNYSNIDYFVPRVIEQEHLQQHSEGEEAEKVLFPVKGNASDISLYLGIRLVPQGAVAIFCGRKDEASKIASRVIKVYEGNFSLPPPSEFSDIDEQQKLSFLINSHFGESADISRAAILGVFVHTGNTPHGLRLCIEYAMQMGMIKFVACTSTLAQGVNLPIRYLIVSSVYQSGAKIKVRDFQNLIGRAGRAGMHTEGLVVFADPQVYDKRFSRFEQWRFNASVDLLNPGKTENTTSSILDLFSPFYSLDKRPAELRVPPDILTGILMADQSSWTQWCNETVSINPQYKFDASKLFAELKRRRRLLVAVESYLMANRGTTTFDDFKAGVERLAVGTLAYHVADNGQKHALITLFSSLADYVQNQESSPEKQAVYAKTLLGVSTCRHIEQWTNINHDALLNLQSNDEWLDFVWPLFSEHLDDKFFHSVKPEGLSIELARAWLNGAKYSELFKKVGAVKGTKPWGSKQRRKLTDDDVISFCEGKLSFDCALILAAVSEFLFGWSGTHTDEAAVLNLFQKALKYGLPDRLSISTYEVGFADRILAQRLRDAVEQEGFPAQSFSLALNAHRERIANLLTDYPTYFSSVLNGLTEKT